MKNIVSWLRQLLQCWKSFFGSEGRDLAHVFSSKTSGSVSLPPQRILELYEGKPLGHEQTKKDEARRYLRRIDPETQAVRGPSAAQEDLIFSEARGLAVLAGAGSGKSTSLVSRVLFMRHQLDIPYSQISVFTFTRKSREDFVKKLVEESAHWPYPVGEKLAQRVVRTFHSKALAMARGAMDPNTKIFEFLGAPKKKMNTEEVSVRPVGSEALSDEESDDC